MLRGFRLARGSCFVAKLPVSTLPEHVQGNLAPLLYLDFIDSSFGRQGTHLNLGKGSEIQNSDFRILKIQMAKLPYYIL
jgi:hypothetical protein